MRLDYQNAAQFKALLQALEAVNSEVVLSCKVDGVRAREMDSSHIVMFDLTFFREALDEYYLDADEEIILDIPTILKGALNRTEKNDLIRIETEQNEISKTAKITLMGRLRRTTKIILLDKTSNYQDVPEPKISFTAMAKIVVDDFLDVLKDADKYSDQITIRADKEEIVFEAKGDLGEYSVPVDRGSKSLLCLEVKENMIRATYSLNYLIDIVSAIKRLADVVTLEFANCKPLKMSVELNQINLSYYLAPRITEEDLEPIKAPDPAKAIIEMAEAKAKESREINEVEHPASKFEREQIMEMKEQKKNKDELIQDTATEDCPSVFSSPTITQEPTEKVNPFEKWTNSEIL